MYSPRRLVFDAIFQLSKLAPIGEFASEADLKKDLSLLARAYAVDEITASMFDDTATNGTGYFESVQEPSNTH